jgi:hypothetical protein
MTPHPESGGDGSEAEVSRALNTPRTMGGIDHRVFSLWWGPLGMLIISQKMWWLLGPALVGHAVFYYKTYKNPTWFDELRATIRQPRFLRK